MADIRSHGVPSVYLSRERIFQCHVGSFEIVASGFNNVVRYISVQFTAIRVTWAEHICIFAILIMKEIHRNVTSREQRMPADSHVNEISAKGWKQRVNCASNSCDRN